MAANDDEISGLAKALEERMRREKASDNVIWARFMTKGEIDANSVLEGAYDKLEWCFLVGRGADGSRYAACSAADAARILFELERVKLQLLSVHPSELFVAPKDA